MTIYVGGSSAHNHTDPINTRLLMASLKCSAFLLGNYFFTPCVIDFYPPKEILPEVINSALH